MIYILFCTIFMFVYFMIFTAHHDTIDDRTIQDHRLPREFDQHRIFFISDIHRRKINIHTLRRIKREIHMVVIGGDFTERGVPISRTRENIQKLKQFNAPIYFIWGNNDYEVSFQAFNQMLQEEDVNILKDSYVKLSKSGKRFYVVGFDYHKDGIEAINFDWAEIEDGYCLLLTHVPQYFYDLNPKYQQMIDLVLAGHTHGGQIRLFNLGFYQNGGFSNHFHTNILVSEGYGYTFVPFRFQTKAECHVLTFAASK